MKISAGCLVSLKVKMYDAQGELLEDSGERPLVYLHGAEDIFPKVEAMLDGQQAGFTASVRLEPEDAFGDDDPELLHLVPVAQLGQDVDLGMKVERLPGAPADGRIYTVIDLTDDVAVLDGNHPLAGRTLRFDLEVIGVEPASEEMLAASGRADVPAFLQVGSHGGDSGTRH